MHLDVFIIDNQNLFFDLKDEWNELLIHSSSNTIFLTWEWLYYWWREYGGGEDELHIITVRENNKLVGIAPLYISNKYLFFYKKIQFLGSNVVCSNYLNFIIDKKQEKEVLQNILLFISRHKFWDVLEFSDIPSSSKNFQMIKECFKRYRLNIQKYHTVCPYIDLRADWDSIYNSYEPFLQSTIKRKTKKFFKKNGAKYIDKCPEKEFDNFFLEFLRLNELRLNEKMIRSPFLKSNFKSFHRTVLKELQSKGMAKMSFLQIKDQVIAGIYLLIYNERYHYYQSGFDPSVGNFSPGTLLLQQTIKTAFAEGIKEFDFLQGDEKYKEQWTKLKRENSLLTVFNNTLKGQMLSVCGFLFRKTKKIYKMIFKHKSG